MYTSKNKNESLDLDKEYAPSRNTRRFANYPKSNEKVIENYCDILDKETKRVKEKYKVISNVSYISDNASNEKDNRFVDIYYKDQANGTPIFIYIHGGYWQEFDRSLGGIFVAPYVDKGYRVISMDYNLCPNVTLHELMDQTIDFYKWLMNYAHVTKAPKIELLGHSAGSHLLALLFHKNISPSSFTIPITNLYFISGVYDLRELYKLESVNPNNIFSLNEKGSENASPMLWKLESSLVEYFNRNNTKIHVLVGQYEGDTFINQSKEYAQKLSESGLQTIFKIFDNYDHFNIIEEVPIKCSSINKYLMENTI